MLLMQKSLSHLAIEGNFPKNVPLRRVAGPSRANINKTNRPGRFRGQPCF